MKRKLAELLVKKGFAENFDLAQRMIMSGKVLVNGVVQDKPGITFHEQVELTVLFGKKWVSRGGFKLEKALDLFSIDVKNKICADVGCSTGGFTDVLLQNGALKVYSIDTSYGVLDWKLRNSEKVIVMEKTNVLDIACLQETPQVITVDTSFTVMGVILPHLRKWIPEDVKIPEVSFVTLIKPQYEVDRHELKEGVVSDKYDYKTLLNTIVINLSHSKIYLQNMAVSPILGGGGNKEFLAHFGLSPNDSFSRIIDNVFS